jgi:periplasmic copper chaperone A
VHNITSVNPGRRTSQTLAASLIAFLIVLAPSTAWAHVSVNPSSAEKGGYAKLAFRVPTENATLATTRLEVHLPEKHTMTSVRVHPKPGWDYTIEKTKLDKPINSHGTEISEVVSKITWTASGPGIKPGEFDEFEVSVGALPTDVDQFEFKALQTYSDGSVVRWIDPTVAGDEEPDRPAPTLKLTSPDTDETPSAGDDSADTDDNGNADAALIVAVVALVVAIGSGLMTILRRRNQL